MIELTDTAKQKIQKELTRRNKGLGIKIGVKTTGCNGLAYILEYVDVIDTENIVFEYPSFNLYIDKKSMVYLDGMKVDYVRESLNEGFKFINPNEKARCGCGSSFSI